MSDLAEIYDGYREDPAFAHLRIHNRPLVPGEGSSNPKVLIVGEAPGATENLQRRPFVGASGRILRSLIADAAELRPEDYFITNMVKYWPGPGNRTPNWTEMEASLPYLWDEYLAIGAPQVIIAVGGFALWAFRPEGETRGILALGGKLIGLEGGRWLAPMVHPSYGIRNKKYQPTMEEHWTSFGEWFRKEFE
jgi:DNA polymerase